MLEKSLRECLSFSRDPGTNKETSFRSALEIVRVLRQAQCCFRCCLRFVGCKRLDLYDSPEQDLEKAFSTLLEDKGETQTRVQVCTACVGSLQIVDSPTFLKAVSDTIFEQNYDAKDVQLNSTLPISTLHRDHLLSLHLSDTLNTTSSPRDPKEIFKHILGKHMQEQMKLRIDNKGSLKITVVLQHEPTASEHLFLTQVKDPVLQIRKKVKKGKTMVFGDSRSTILEALKALSREEAKTLTTVPPQAPTDAAKLSSVDMVHDSCIVGGRYMKYSREFSQTPWAIKGKKLAENSVSECIEGVLKKYYRCDDCKFVPAGREDANVRMLGTGRPFYCELSNPRHTMLTTEEYQKMQQEINTSETKDAVQIRDLSPVKAANTKLIKEGEQHKRKTYRALVWVSEKVTPEMIEKVNAHGSQPFAIQQNTPVRVFQRRSGAIREKMIYHCKVVPPPKKDQADEISDRFLVLTMTAQAGTYIKEFVHGDLGRTIPNLASIAGIQAADLIELDVMNVDLEWPPK